MEWQVNLVKRFRHRPTHASESESLFFQGCPSRGNHAAAAEGARGAAGCFRSISLCGSCARRYCGASRFPEVMTGKNC